MEEHRSLSVLSLFRFASRQDKALLSVATVLAVVGGTIVPLLLLSLGDLHGAMVRMGMESAGKPCHQNFKWDPDTVLIAKRDFGINLTAIKWQDITNILGYVRNKLNLTTVRIGGRNSYPKELLEHIREPFLEESASICLHMGWLVLAQLVTLYATTALAGMAAASQGCRIRAAFFRSLMHQDIAWFDSQHQENFAVRIIGSLDRIQEGLGEKATLTVLNFATSVTCFLTAFVNGWKLTLIVMALMPFICLTAAVIAKYQVTFTHRGLKAYSAAGTVAEESFSGIRTVIAYGGQNKELDRYCRGLRGAHLWGVRLAVSMGAGYGLVWLLSFSSFGIGLWFGTRMVFGSRCSAHVFSSSNLVIVILSILNSALALAQLAENFEAFSVAKASAYKIFEIIDRIPHINSRCRSGQRLKDLSGNITFANVHFQYPLRPDVPVINGLSFNVNSGDTVALVGASGCGKSTLIQLLQRFYDPVYGEILLDGCNIRDLNVGWLRSQMGLVSQEPALFETTIAENILLGNPDAGEGAVVQAAIAAHAHDFIIKLPKQYNTLVGEKGTQLSGGQKQRIAIARALVRNPKILLLDEATSALDSVSEYAVQAALDQVRKGRTTLIIAHRLSTIRNADRIIFIRNGRVAEMGTHTELLARESLYYQFVISQGTLGKGSPTESDQSFDEAELPSFSPTTQGLSRREHGHVRRKSLKDTILSILPIEEVKEKRRQAMSSYRFRLLKLCFPEWWLIALGSLCSLILGVSFPRFAVIFGDAIQALLIPTIEQAYSTLNQNAINLFIIAISSSVSSFFQNVFFGIAGERMTIRLRKKIFMSMLSQELSWYDDPRNSTGTLCSRLSSDPASVRLDFKIYNFAIGSFVIQWLFPPMTTFAATVDRLCSLTQAVSTMIFCIYIMFGIHTKMAFVAVSLLPIIILTTYLNTKVFGTHHLMEKLAEEGSSETAVEAIRSIRTVASLHRQDTFIEKFISSMKKPYTSVNTFCHLKGLMYGISQSCMALSCVLVLHYGTEKIVDGEIDFNNLFSTVQGVIIFSLVITNVLIKAPDANKARVAAERIFQIVERKPATMSSHGRTPATPIRGNITFRNVHFSYPLRPETKVLKGMDLFVKAGQTVALVGTSGCGKSTCIALLQRFYDCKRGEVLIDGVNVHEYEVGWLRSQMGLVSQEPVLFGVSLAENIAYGARGGKFVAEDFIEAARTANIHNFICALPEGYQTQVGSRDIRLSGGEKQRVAIARALVRNPRILLLDEATSALDVESELIVQEALERAREGRTCIVIAHRLSTIQNADQIVVIHDGAVVEKGKHYELLAKKGFYYELYRIQSSPQ